MVQGQVPEEVFEPPELVDSIEDAVPELPNDIGGGDILTLLKFRRPMLPAIDIARPLFRTYSLSPGDNMSPGFLIPLIAECHARAPIGLPSFRPLIL